VLREDRRPRVDFGGREAYACDPVTGRAGRVTPRFHGGSASPANPSAALGAGSEGCPAPLVSLFVPGEGAVGGEPGGEAGQPLHWREP
jgi:hypothetical protein